MKVQHLRQVEGFKKMSMPGLRDTCMLEDLFQPGKYELVYREVYHATIGSAFPAGKLLKSESTRELPGEDCFCQYREVGIIDMGAIPMDDSI